MKIPSRLAPLVLTSRWVAFAACAMAVSSVARPAGAADANKAARS